MINNTIAQEFEKLIISEDIMEFSVLAMPYNHEVFIGQSLDGRPGNTPFVITIWNLDSATGAYNVTMSYENKYRFNGIGHYDRNTGHFELDHDSIHNALAPLDVDIRSAIMFKLLAVNTDK